MAKVIRLVLIGFIGLALVGASQAPEGEQQSDDGGAKDELASGLEAIGSAISNFEIPIEQDPGCRPGTENRDSDLCAQWKAADASSAAANYAFWAVILSSIGTVFLIYTFWDQRKTSRAELRAYIGVRPTKLHTIAGADGGFEAQIEIFNAGSTPAYDLVYGGNIIVGTADWLEAELSRTDKRTEIGRPHPFTLQPGENTKASCASSIVISRQIAEGLAQRELYAVLFGFVRYRDAFGKTRTTRFSYLAEDAFPPVKSSSEDPIIIDMNWALTPYHNNST